MTTKQITDWVNEIRKEANEGDSETAHMKEDALRREFISYVASLGDLPALSAKAKLILATDGIEFHRWCA